MSLLPDWPRDVGAAARGEGVQGELRPQQVQADGGARRQRGGRVRWADAQ